jgi:hypothetical protein
MRLGAPAPNHELVRGAEAGDKSSRRRYRAMWAISFYASVWGPGSMRGLGPLPQTQTTCRASRLLRGLELR